ncbi:zeta toxin family protein [Pontiellaceae bacterium B1224]|nr:zeta toxin family protein [Pontiellaceae bacterium B1224]
MKKEQPTCYVIAGPNGAGKTTFALRYLPEITGCRNFINADLIADGLSPLDPARVQLEAGKTLLREIRSNVRKRESFAFETTLSGRSYVKLLRELDSTGWKIVLFYLWIPSAEFSKARVEQRVEAGGHDIPADAIARRYSRTVSNFLNVFAPLCDEALCYDNSNTEPVLVFEQFMESRTVHDSHRYKEIMRCFNE